MRINRRLGEIAIPPVSGRDITPDEVFVALVRLRRELELLLPAPPETGGLAPPAPLSPAERLAATSNQVYQALSEASLAFDETLGMRGFAPADVFALSEQVVAHVTFLRQSQHLTGEVERPALTQGNRPNHALAAALAFLKRVSEAEANLWIQPVAVPQPPRQVINPADVYDTLGLALAELQRIQHRLGLEREFSPPDPEPGKTPDDVIQNLTWAAEAMPLFDLAAPLSQYDPAGLVKTSNHVFLITSHLISQLEAYRLWRGIPGTPAPPPENRGMLPRHVYQQGLENLEKIALLRSQVGLGPTVIPRMPVEAIVPHSVFDLTLRMDEELDIIMRRTGFPQALWLRSSLVQTPQDKVPDDVFRNMVRISHLLDVILGSRGYGPVELMHEAQALQAEVRLIQGRVGQGLVEPPAAPLRVNVDEAAILEALEVIRLLVAQAAQRAGLFHGFSTFLARSETPTVSDLFTRLRLAQADLVSIRAHLGVDREPIRPPRQERGDLSEVLQNLEGSIGLLRQLLGVAAADAVEAGS